jgi:protoporphyrinogen oxidase
MVIIIGAGISGLTAARFCHQPSRIFEKKPFPGGLSSQYHSQGIAFDYGGHYFHFQNKAHIYSLLKQFSHLKQYQKKSLVYLNKQLIPFPIQFHLSFLSKSDRNRILAEMEQRDFSNSSNLKMHIEKSFGNHLATIFFYPFLEKYYQTDLSELRHDMDKGSIPVPSMEQVKQGTNGKRFRQVGYNALFYYPEHGLRSFIDHYSDIKNTTISFNSPVTAIDLENKTISIHNKHYSYDTLITTMPLKELIPMISQAHWFPDPERFEAVSTVIVNIALTHRRKRFHWLYIPEKIYPFYRVGYYPGNNPVRCYLELAYRQKQQASNEQLKNAALAILTDIGMIQSKHEIIHIDIISIPISYILFNRFWKTDVAKTLNLLKSHQVYSIGRYGSWTYSSMSDDINYARQITLEL